LAATKSFRNSKYYKSVLNVRKFMFEDIEKTLLLKRRAPNFLLALGLCCYTEYWGKLKIGVSEKDQNRKSRDSFEGFLYEYLDPNYYAQLEKEGADIYKDVRCGLAHAYLIERKTSSIDALHDGNHGIDYDPTSNRYTFYVKTYFIEFKSGVNKYIRGLEDGTENIDLLEQCLIGKPMLI
jgi:hypothetical protein